MPIISPSTPTTVFGYRQPKFNVAVYSMGTATSLAFQIKISESSPSWVTVATVTTAPAVFLTGPCNSIRYTETGGTGSSVEVQPILAER